ncbi:hypothetical protein HS1genome_0773 [Sulfodiicoccus acidiphilus]|uniref:FHA domain-containing protein n=1 Tax=Sulfodiicoccus acidiphilus TaxID=1670455 RepID=A0A348B2I2_9CREN|nr:hypothetical protein HS1genome_0773 [Sulfodiicoccus acidiphilus]GGT97492.1 hypothetical protein GCM10007116_13820 [Sulfodiicoccus acidiphilus]
MELSTFPKVTIGRGTENVIIVPDPEVSRKHATLYMEGDELFLEDSSSTNGTYVYDGESFKKVEKKTKLPQGAVVKLGSFTTLKFTAE